MPRPSLRTRSAKRAQVRLPGGRTVVRYKKGKPNPARCSRCSRELHGIPRLRPSELRKLTRTQRSVGRMYGGQLCSDCLEELLKQAVRSL